ncbi:MAG TPA: hypothetical protein DCY26_08740, partial [Hyphomonas sp.]|nr:hypothetical protein [Hyphomonas sp.]
RGGDASAGGEDFREGLRGGSGRRWRGLRSAGGKRGGAEAEEDAAAVQGTHDCLRARPTCLGVAGGAAKRALQPLPSQFFMPFGRVRRLSLWRLGGIAAKRAP